MPLQKVSVFVFPHGLFAMGNAPLHKIHHLDFVPGVDEHLYLLEVDLIVRDRGFSQVLGQMILYCESLCEFDHGASTSTRDAPPPHPLVAHGWVAKPVEPTHRLKALRTIGHERKLK